LEQVLLATLLTHPGLIAEFEAALENLELSDPGYDQLRSEILRHAHDAPAEFRKNLEVTQRSMLEMIFSQSHVTSAPPVRNAEDEELARMCLAEGLAKLDARHGARREIEDAAQDLDGLADEGLTWRLSEATKALHRAEKSNLEDASDMGEDRAALSKHLQNLIDGEIWVKKKG
jgi:DNA primase